MVSQSSKPSSSASLSPVNADDQPIIFPRRKAGQSKKNGSKAGVVVTLEILEQVFDMPLHRACKSLGVCATAFKKVCRKLGVMKWPYKDSHLPPKKESSRRRSHAPPARVSARTNAQAERSSERLQVKHSIQSTQGMEQTSNVSASNAAMPVRGVKEEEEERFISAPLPPQQQEAATRPPMYIEEDEEEPNEIWSSSPASTSEEERMDEDEEQDEQEQQPEWLDLCCGLEEEDNTNTFASSCLTTAVATSKDDFVIDDMVGAKRMDGSTLASASVLPPVAMDPSEIIIAGGSSMGFSLNSIGSETEDNDGLDGLFGVQGAALWSGVC